MLNRFLFGTTTVVILVLTLLSRDLLNGIYLSVAQMLPIDPALITEHTTMVSNIGHFVSCFILTCLGYRVFRASLLKIFFCVAGVAVFGEFLQSFTATRQANLEDIILSFSGIFLALTTMFFIKRNSFSAPLQNQ